MGNKGRGITIDGKQIAIYNDKLIKILIIETHKEALEKISDIFSY